MAELDPPNTFTAGTTIVANDMNTNFTHIKTWANGTPTLSTTGSLTTISGTLSVQQFASFYSGAYIGLNSYLAFEGTSEDANETRLKGVNPTNNDNIIELPDASGTVALLTDVISPNSSNNILATSIFN